MYLHLGQDVMVPNRSIIGVFDLDTSTVTQNTRDFLTRAEREGRVVNVSENLPKSFVLCLREGKSIIYISPLSAQTLLGRARRTSGDRKSGRINQVF